MMFGKLRSEFRLAGTRHQRMPPIPSQWDGVTQLLHACAVVAAPESDVVLPALLLPLNPW